MGVRTRADEYREKTREAIKAADEALAVFVLEVFVRECWGHDEFAEGYEQEVREASCQMQAIRELVG